MGRKKLSVVEKVIKGTFRPERENPDEPIVEIKIPKCPTHLNKLARKEWRRTSQKLFDQGALTEITMAYLAAYCQAYGRWVEAGKVLNKAKGFFIKTKSGNIIQHPLVGIVHTEESLMIKSLKELIKKLPVGSKITSKKTGKKKDPWLKFG